VRFVTTVEYYKTSRMPIKRTDVLELDCLRPYLIEKFQQWIRKQRSIHLATARSLFSGEKSRLGGYFEKRILDLARVTKVERIRNPEFCDTLAKSRVPIPIDFSNAVGLTLVDCILNSERALVSPAFGGFHSISRACSHFNCETDSRTAIIGRIVSLIITPSGIIDAVGNEAK